MTAGVRIWSDLNSKKFMETEFIYWRHPSLPGIKVEEVSGGEDRQGNVWLEMARQIYCENGKDTYREIGHFHNGAPFLYGEQGRISVTHCRVLLAVATLPPTPEVELGVFSERTALGIDAERADRTQVLKVRDKFLSETELRMVAPEDTEANIIAWTSKEAALKAVMDPSIDWREDIRILRMPRIGPAVVMYDPAEFHAASKDELLERVTGRAEVTLRADSDASAAVVELLLYSYRSDDHIVTLAYSPKCAKFGRNSQ